MILHPDQRTGRHFLRFRDIRPINPRMARLQTIRSARGNSNGRLRALRERGRSFRHSLMITVGLICVAAGPSYTLLLMTRGDTLRENRRISDSCWSGVFLLGFSAVVFAQSAPTTTPASTTPPVVAPSAAHRLKVSEANTSDLLVQRVPPKYPEASLHAEFREQLSSRL